jgi:hypothetical protein
VTAIRFADGTARSKAVLSGSGGVTKSGDGTALNADAMTYAGGRGFGRRLNWTVCGRDGGLSSFNDPTRGIRRCVWK